MINKLRSGPLLLLFILCIIFLFTSTDISAQENIRKYNPDVTRILFVLDGSGSMKEQWTGKTKFAVSKELLYNMMDSLEKKHGNIEFAIRIFGHQYDRSLRICQDSKLEVPFAKKNAAKINDVLQTVTPQGWTPIAYSLFLAADDFPQDPTAKNAIVLITDGLETCEGDPCAAGEALRKKRIVLRPFIIGLGLAEDEKESFDCVGTYFDASNAENFSKALHTVISQALNNTTVQVNLLNSEGKPTETNVEMTFYDAFSGAPLYNFIHTLQGSGLPDTLFLDPVGKYNLTIHTIPPISKNNIELTPGKHNIIALDAAQGMLKLNVEDFTGLSVIQCAVRKAGTGEIIKVQDFNSSIKYIEGNYDLEILTLPRKMIKNVKLADKEIKEINVPKNGTLTLLVEEPLVASIYIIDNDEWVKIYSYRPLKGREALAIQPGEYRIVYRPVEARNSMLTKTEKFEIKPGTNTMVRL